MNLSALKQGTQIRLLTLTEQGNRFAWSEAPTAGGHELTEVLAEAILRYLVDENGTVVHDVDVIAKEHEELTARFGRIIIGGFEIVHTDRCCPLEVRQALNLDVTRPRRESIIIPPAVRIGRLSNG